MDLDKHFGTIALGLASIGVVWLGSSFSESRAEIDEEHEHFELEHEMSPQWGEYIKKRQREIERESIHKKARGYLSSKYGSLGKYFGRR